MEAIQILDFNIFWLVFNGLMALGGVISTELLIYAIDEEKYKIATRKGDVLFAIWTAPLLATFGMPYLWFYSEGSSLFGFTFSLGWYNPLTNILLGLLIDIIIKGVRKYATKKNQ